MKLITITSSLLFLATMSLTGLAFAENEKSFASNVDMTTGAINVPEDYTLWPTLGTWTHAKVESGAVNIHEYHVVYTQPTTIAYYKKKERFPDGAVLVKELLHAEQHKEWIKQLLTEYYDPMYDYQIQNKSAAIAFQGNAVEVLDYLKALD